MTRARHVLDAIDDALVIAQRHPALFARMSRAGQSVIELRIAYDAYLAGVPTCWWFTGERFWGRNRRRAAGKRQRQARKVQR